MAAPGPGDPRRWFGLMLAAPAIVLFTLAPLFSPKGLPHWSMPGWLFLFPLLGLMLTRAAAAGKAWPRRWAVASAAILIIVGALAVQEAATGWLAALARRGARFDIIAVAGFPRHFSET